MGQDILRGFLRALPMGLGYIVIGFSVAATAFGAGFDASNVVAMSAMVCAGTSQLIATQLLADHASLVAVIATTFIVNLRHLLMSSAVAPMLSRFSRPWLALFCFGLSDEAFALHSQALAKDEMTPVPEMLAINFTLWLTWGIGALLAVWLRIDASVLYTWGLDYSPQAMFIALLALLIGDARQWLVAGFCAAVSVALGRFGAGAETVIVTTIIGASLGVGLEAWTSKKSFSPSSA